MTRTQKTFVGLLALLVAWVFVLLLDALFAPAYFQAPVGMVGVSALGYYASRLVVIPLVTLLAWPGGGWLWRKGQSVPMPQRLGRLVIYALAVTTWAMALLLLVAALRSWFIH